ncbi:uncharacterized protein LOC112884714 isoform X3 [Panicum hallii]|uniref:uncharacterized protein LOC112884714 isoform X3 n=1 Tax=Panicum hallii TaxID=206008 RepID=UPI000DF4E61D|nr:uncharacterized protein LOC112884714 isoform X3 [Panicum hallii]
MDLAGMKRRELQALCKRHGLPAGGTNADLVARLDAALSGAAGAEEEEDVVGVVARKGCLKRSVGDAGEAKKVTFAVEESRGRRLRSRVVWSPVVAKTRGKRAEAGSTDSAADDGIPSRAGENVPVRRSRRNSLAAAEVEEVEEAVTFGRKRKPKSQEIAEDVAVSAQPVASCRVTRRSSLSGTTVLLPPAVEKKRGRGKAAAGKNKLVTEEQAAEAQGLSAAAPLTVVESKRSRRKGPDVQNSSKVEVSAKTTRSRSVEAVMKSPPVLENKRKRKSGDAQPDVEQPPVAEVPRNDAPVTRSLRNRVVQVNNSVVEETHTTQQPENKMQPNRPATRMHQQVASSVEKEDQVQVAAPSKAPPSRRSKRNNYEANNVNSESNKLISAPVEAKDSKIAHPLTHHNAKAEDVEKQPIVREPVRRSTRKSVASAMLDNEKDLIEEKNPEAHVRRSLQRSIVPVEDIKGAGEEIQNAKGEDAPKQLAVKEPVRRSTRKSVVSAMLEKEKVLIAEKNPGAHVKRSMRKSVVPVQDINGVGEDIQNAKSDDAEKQLVMNQPVRRSSCKSVLPDTLENESGSLVTETNAEAHVRARKSLLPNMLNKEDPDHSKMIRNENFQIGKCEDEKQQKVKEPVRRSRRSVATVMLEEQNKGLHEEKMSTIPVRRSTRKSVALNIVEKGSNRTEKVGREQSGVRTRRLKARDKLTDHAVAVEPVVTSGNELQVDVQNNQGLTVKSPNHNLSDGNETHPGSDKFVSCERVGEEGLKLRKHRTSSMEISSSANDFWNMEDFSGQKFRKQQSTQTPCEKDNTGAIYDKPQRVQQASTSTTSKGRSSKRRRTRTTAPEEVMSAEEANDGMIIREETMDTHKTSHEYSKESSSGTQEICQVSATREGFSSGPLLGTVTLPDEIYTTQSVHKVIPASETGGLAKESSEKSKQPQEHSDIQDDDTHLSEIRNGKLDQSSSITELLPHNAFVSEDKTLMGEDVLPVDFTVGDDEGQSPAAGQGRVGWEANTSESEEKNLADAMSTGLHTKSLQHDIDILAEESGEDVVPMSFTTEEHGIKFKVSPIAVERRVIGQASACESAGKTLTGILSNDLRTKYLQHDRDVLTKEIGEASGSSIQISDSNPEIHCDAIAEESIRAADLGSCPSNGGKGNPLLKNLHDSILPVMNSAQRCSSDGRRSSFGLDFLFTEECKENCSRNVENITVEVDGGNKSSTCVSPDFYVGSDCGLEDEDVQPTGFDADKKLDVDQDAAEEEVVVEEKNYDQHVAPKTDLKAKLNGELTGLDMESDCTIAEKNVRFVEDNPDDEEVTVQVQQANVQEGDSEKPSQFSATPECKHEFCLPDETVLHSKKNKGCLSSEEQSPFGLQSLFLQQSIEKSVECGALASATVIAENGFDELKYVHVKCSLKKTRVSEPFSQLDTDEDSCPVSKNEDCMFISQQDKGIEGLSKASLDEESVPSGFSLDAKHIKEVTNSEEVACKGEGSKKLVHSDDLKASSEKTDVNGPDTIENSSFSLATPGYKHDDALSEEAVRTMKKYAGTCSSNPRELLMDLQSLFSKENIEESDLHDGLAFSSAESPGDESIDVEQLVEVHLGSNPSQLESNDLLDELIGCSKTEVLHQGHKGLCSEDREEQKLESPIVMESSLNCNKDVTNSSINGSVVDIVDQRTPSGSALPEDCRMDHNLQREFLDGCSVDSGVAGTIGNPSFNLATPDHEHEGALSEEAVCKMKKYTGTCSGDPRHLLMELQSLFSEGSIIKSDSHDVAFPCSESEGNEPTVCHVEKLVDTLVSSEPDTCQGLRQDLSRAEEKESCVSISMQLNPELEDDEVEKHSLNCEKDTSQILGITRSVLSKTALLPKDSHTIYWQEQELPNDLSPLKSGTCQSNSQKHIVESNSRPSSCDTEVLQQDHKDESNICNEDKSIPKVLENDMPEAAPVERMDSAIMLPSVAGKSEMSDELLNTELSDEAEEHSLSSDKYTIKNFCTGSAKNDLFALPKDCHMDTCQKQELPDVHYLPKSPGESANCQDESVSGSGPCQTSWQQCINESRSVQVTSNIEAFNQNQEESNQNNEGQITPIPSVVSEAADIERSEREIGLTPPAGPSALPDEQLITKVECHEVDTSSLFDTELLYSKASNLHTDTRKDHPPSDLSAPRSPEESTSFPNSSVPGSVGICQSSRRRGIDELRAKLQSFKVSSTAKGSYIAMSAPLPKQGDNLSQSAIALLRNSENAPAVKLDHPANKRNPDCSVAKDSSRQALQHISGRPRDRL